MAVMYDNLPPATALTPSLQPNAASPIVQADRKTYNIAENTPPTVQVHALSAGHFSLPEEQFVSPSSPGARNAVPSLCFLVKHVCSITSRTTHIVFDLGLRRNVKRYPDSIQQHLTTREPYVTDPDVVRSLKAGGLTPDDIQYVVYSHVHWDHVGEPHDFPRSTFVVGHGSLDVLQGKATGFRGNHSHFEEDLLDMARTVELPSPENEQPVSPAKENGCHGVPLAGHFSSPWQPLGALPQVLDMFQDGSLYVVDAPGHLPGHINLLARVIDSDTGGTRWVYLAGDACHDRRILRREKEIGEWHDVHGNVCCIHANRAEAEETIERIRGLEKQGVEVIFAHDVEFESNPKNKSRFFGAVS